MPPVRYWKEVFQAIGIGQPLAQKRVACWGLGSKEGPSDEKGAIPKLEERS